MKKRSVNINLSLDEVLTLDRVGLVRCWEDAFGLPPPRQAHVEFLRQAIGWQVQAHILGGLDYACRKILQRGSVGLALTSGTMLVRQWQGVSHQVTVLEKGFDYDGQVYRSLSAIARKITGTAWNGLTFFGVKK